MENAKTMREIALAAMREKVAKEFAMATELVEGPITNIIMKSAHAGLMEVILPIPIGYSVPLVIQILEEHGYKVSNTQKFGDYLIKW